MRRRSSAALRVAVVAATVIAVELGAASPASAHTVGGVSATDYQSEIVGVAPPTTTISARLLDLGRRIQLTNTAGADLVVLGYQGEAYLRIGPSGVFENVHSPAVYQNRLLPPGVTASTLPAIALPTAAPEWHKISTAHTATWRDRRTRWEGPRPAAVLRSPTRTTAVADWAIPIRQGSDTLQLEGRLVWVPPPNPLPWLGLALVFLLVAVGVGRSRWWSRGLSTLLALLVAADISRSYATALISGGSIWIQLLRTLLAGEIGFVLWAVGIGSVALLQRQHEGGLLIGAFASLGIGLFDGVTDLPYLLHSQIPVAAPAVAARAGVAMAIGLGLGLALACFLRLRSMPVRP